MPLGATSSAPPLVEKDQYSVVLEGTLPLCLRLCTGGRVLELGCGTGASSRWLSQQGFKVTAVDISAPALRTAAAAAAAEGLPAGNPEWLLRDIFELTTSCQQLPIAGALAHGADSACGSQPTPTPQYQGCFEFIYDCQGGLVAFQI
jgi:SAM-dependent methyltransferase